MKDLNQARPVPDESRGSEDQERELRKLDLIKQNIRTILEPIREDLFRVILFYNGTLKSCGYGASIVTSLLKKGLPDSQIRIGYGYKGHEFDLAYHFWTEVDDAVYVDATYGQYDPRVGSQILVRDIESLADLDLHRLDRSKPQDFSQVITERCGKRTVVDLVDKPDEPFIPGFQFIWEPQKRDFTLQAIEHFSGRIGR